MMVRSRDQNVPGKVDETGLHLQPDLVRLGVELAELLKVPENLRWFETF